MENWDRQRRVPLEDQVQSVLRGGLRDAKDVVVRGVQPVGRGLVDTGGASAERVLVAVREEPLQQTGWSITWMLRT